MIAILAAFVTWWCWMHCVRWDRSTRQLHQRLLNEALRASSILSIRSRFRQTCTALREVNAITRRGSAKGCRTCRWMLFGGDVRVYMEITIHIHKVVAELVFFLVELTLFIWMWHCSRFNNAYGWWWSSSWWLAYKNFFYNGWIYGWSEASTFQCIIRSGITIKIPLSADGSTYWFKYEELIEDRLDFAVLDEIDRGPALKNRLVGDAEMDKGLFNWVSLRAADGVKYFLDLLRSHFVKEDNDVFLWTLSQCNKQEEEVYKSSHGSAVFIVFQASDGYLAAVWHALRTKTKSISCQHEKRKWRKERKKGTFSGSWSIGH